MKGCISPWGEEVESAPTSRLSSPILSPDPDPGGIYGGFTTDDGPSLFGTHTTTNIPAATAPSTPPSTQVEEADTKDRERELAKTAKNQRLAKNKSADLQLTTDRGGPNPYRFIPLYYNMSVGRFHAETATQLSKLGPGLSLLLLCEPSVYMMIV